MINFSFFFIKLILLVDISNFKDIMSSIKKTTIVFNQTTDEWIITYNEKDYWKKMKYLLAKNTRKDDNPIYEGIISDADDRQSRWRRDDKIVLMDLNKNNKKYFHINKSKINIDNDESVVIIDLTI